MFPTEVLEFTSQFLLCDYNMLLVCKSIHKPISERRDLAIRVLCRFFFRFRTLPEFDWEIRGMDIDQPWDEPKYTLCEPYIMNDPWTCTKKYMIRQFIRYQSDWDIQDICIATAKVVVFFTGIIEIIEIRDVIRNVMYVITQILNDLKFRTSNPYFYMPLTTVMPNGPYTFFTEHVPEFGFNQGKNVLISRRHLRSFLGCFSSAQIACIGW
tara:strand:- start:8 stop:640 length:633 start_codon:yes stop_codon:yes gene_type:complete